MFNRLKFAVYARAVVQRATALGIAAALALFGRANAARFLLGGTFHATCYRPDGTIAWSDAAKNGVTDAGIAHALNVLFRATTPVTAWYLLLIDNAGYTALAAGDTSALHAGWAEAAGSNYSNSNRPQWSPGAPSSGAIVNASTADFLITAVSPLTIKGLGAISDNTKGGTTGTLFATALFTGGNQVVNNGDTLKVTYTVSAASN